MTTIELAQAFTRLLKDNRHIEAAAAYNSPDIVSIEAMDGPMAVCRGAQAVREKSEWWYANHEVHGGTVAGPYVNGDLFVVHFTMDITVKATGERMSMSEVGIYTVAGGKIAEERFCYLQA